LDPEPASSQIFSRQQNQETSDTIGFKVTFFGVYHVYPLVNIQKAVENGDLVR
jgi:hypothetical protein